MRIKKIDIPKSENSNDGLENIKMDRLEKIVLIAGKNGSGKTRILNKIFTLLNSKPRKIDLENAKSQIEINNRNLVTLEKEFIDLQKKLINTSSQSIIEEINRNISQNNKLKERSNKEIKNIESKLNWNKIETSELADLYSSVSFVPKSLDLKDCNSFTKNEIINSASNLNQVGIEYLPNGTFSKIQTIQDRWFNSTHQISKYSKDEKENAITDYDKLDELIKIFLNTSIGRTIDGEATLFGFPLGKTNLSDGQKILLQFCIAIYSQETALKDLILILDEPENHLHPSVIIETIEKILKCVKNGQIWIATHSIPILAHFDPSLIWYVENNTIRHAGKIPEKVLHSLLGNEDEVAKLQDFISLPSQYATSRFAFESLFEPRVVLTNSDDPQSFQIRKELLKLSDKGILRILDYGAGKGRLISNIVDLDEVNQDKLIKKIDYIAYDKFDKDKELCENALFKAYGISENRYFNNFHNILSKYDKGSFNVVIMCNVLHEIDPKDWLELFKNEGKISNLLIENGFLLLVEDHKMPIGEKAYQKGFLVLDTPQLKNLFKISEKDTDFKCEDKNDDGRLKAHLIPKQCLARIDESSRLSSLRSISATAKDKILEIRDLENNYQNGKLHGFWTQQFANAQLCLDELTIE